MSSQLGALDFISEGSTRRKEILAKFLDLEFFERKFRLAKKESSDTKGYLKKLETFNLDADEEEIGNQQDEVLSLIEQKETACEGYEKELTKLNAELQDTEEKIDSVPEEIIDAKSVKSDIATSEIMIENIDRKIKGYEDKIQDSGDFLATAEDVLLQFNEEELLDEAS